MTLERTRGERNRNPGNLDRTATMWQGQIQDAGEPRFCVFDTPENGIRALAKTLLAYYRKHALNTVRGIINRWAPPVENDTSAYVNAVAEQCSVAPDDVINPENSGCLEMLVRAIIHQENGRVIYDDATIVKAIDEALA